MFSHLSFNCVLLLLLLLLLLTRSLEGAYTVEVGQNAVLPCSYSPTSSANLVPVCWGRRACPLSHCQKTVLSTDGRHVNYQKSSRYQLKGHLQKGDVSLTIEKVTLADGGTYCCRVEFPGLMNDKKFNLELVIKPETQTRENLYEHNQTQKFTLANELQHSAVTAQIAIYIGAGISAGMVLVLIFGALTLKWYSYKKKKLQNSSFISMANLPPSGLANAVEEGMRSEENIYTIEENIYEMEDSNEYYCYSSEGQQP